MCKIGISQVPACRIGGKVELPNGRNGDFGSPFARLDAEIVPFRCVFELAIIAYILRNM